jgi:hypothetical protein
MSQALTWLSNQDCKVTFTCKNSAGTILAPPPAGTTITSDNTAVVSRGDLSSDGSYAILRTAGVGTANVTVANGSGALVFAVTVGAAVTTSIVFGAATLVANGTPVT